MGPVTTPRPTDTLSPAQVADRLGEAVASGDFTRFAEVYAADAVLDASLPGGRSRAAGPDRLTGVLSSWFPGPGELVEWSPRLHPNGVALWLERASGGGTVVRQRHYLSLRDGRVDRHWVYSASPRTSPPGGDANGGV